MKKTTYTCALLLLVSSQYCYADVQGGGKATLEKRASVPTDPLTAPPAPPSQPPAPPANAAPPVSKVDCLYQTTTNPLSETELKLWAQYAASKSFDYSFDTLDTQLQKLKSCYTEKGWAGFNDALTQSGNLNTIKTQKLTVSSQVSGKPEVSLVKDDQWRVTLPLNVVYQNTKEKLTQSLTIVMVITKKSKGELGIVQLIASPIPQATEKTTSQS